MFGDISKALSVYEHIGLLISLLAHRVMAYCQISSVFGNLSARVGVPDKVFNTQYGKLKQSNS